MKILDFNMFTNKTYYSDWNHHVNILKVVALKIYAQIQSSTDQIKCMNSSLF